MVNKYLYWSKDLEIRKYETGRSLLAIKNNYKNERLTRDDIQTYKLNNNTVEIIGLIDGTKTYEEIIYLLSTKHNESSKKTREKLSMFLNKITNLYGIKINEQESTQKINMNIIEKYIYPHVASVEITNKCNVKCMHCFGNFSCIETSCITLEHIKGVLHDLKNIGVKKIEFTGGESTVYTNLKEVLLHAIKLDFDNISLLVNGVGISDEVVDIIIKNSSKIYTKVDLHSLNNDYFTWFSKIPNILDTVKNNIIKLAKSNVKMKVETIVTRKNIHEIEYIAEWIHNLGIRDYEITPVTFMGRADNVDSELYLNIQDFKCVNDIVGKINKKYKSNVAFTEGRRFRSKGFGFLTPHLGISYNGDINICTMDKIEYFNSRIGNIFEKSIKDIYHEKSEYIKDFLHLGDPIFKSLETKDCEQRSFYSN
ncbi:radical SAM protein [Paraclostridium bifermentans]|uniref:radical SAM protein n=1 Tax=Paraclostridium bifermentans TaxID=1490 RepID=UPI0003F63A2B|nr:radical SAM protein [Paraclostridium bifermentans]MCU9808284.1 radical SAM protein [Paraclostridium sp. AKS46]MDV8113440.1 radical SAM protein [Bacillus sp. BAU-SS-2023]